MNKIICTKPFILQTNFPYFRQGLYDKNKMLDGFMLRLIILQNPALSSRLIQRC